MYDIVAYNSALTMKIGRFFWNGGISLVFDGFDHSKRWNNTLAA